ncbi:MAG: cytochrome c3 family protein [Anaerolineaceae bacterium]|nr:cytochrome c3 family protein [Anaerolineaceae bacterium]
MKKIFTVLKTFFTKSVPGFFKNCLNSVFHFSKKYSIIFLILVVIFVPFTFTKGAWEASYNPQFCNMCHIIRPYVESYQTSGFEDNLHMEANVVCKDCHEVSMPEAIGEALTYVTFQYDDPMRPRRVSKETCLKCHRSYEEMTLRTADLERNPHDGHWGTLECNICHKSHEASTNYCSGCHDVEVVFQP